MRKQIELICPVCNKTYLKAFSEYKRNLKVDRVSYCSTACHAKNTIDTKIPNGSTYDISKHCSNRIDEHTPFKYYVKLMNLRKNKSTGLTTFDLIDIWNKQKGVCPYTNIKLKLATHTTRPTKQLDVFQYASIDRIDSSGKYTKDNIEFVSLGINFLKNKFTKEQVITFLTLIQK